ncbi:Nicotinamide/nicotinic acid mononucleotide adenylyltransferase [Capsicum annuum]|nr:Nicotinamide/nicotinic acid mononucleotide adenylyltransferase [Capsicum annuum]
MEQRMVTFMEKDYSFTIRKHVKGKTDIALPLDKLSLDLLKQVEGPPSPERRLSHQSFNVDSLVMLFYDAHLPFVLPLELPIHKLARDALTSEGFCVIGGYMSPVNDASKKKSLVSAEHRVAMCELACKSSEFVMTDRWEASQDSYQRTFTVLSRIKTAVIDGSLASTGVAIRGVRLSNSTRSYLQIFLAHELVGFISKFLLTIFPLGRFDVQFVKLNIFTSITQLVPLIVINAHVSYYLINYLLPKSLCNLKKLLKSEHALLSGEDFNKLPLKFKTVVIFLAEDLKVMLVCGSDLLESFSTPGIWIPEQVRAICRDFGLVCVRRGGQDVDTCKFAEEYPSRG